jgi:hypothetical protein
MADLVISSLDEIPFLPTSPMTIPAHCHGTQHAHAQNQRDWRKELPDGAPSPSQAHTQPSFFSTQRSARLAVPGRLNKAELINA